MRISGKTVLFLLLAVILGISQVFAGPNGSSSKKSSQAEGRFGKGFYLRPNGVRRGCAEAVAAYNTFPLTVECWAKLNGSGRFNILVASESKASGTHWEIYSYAGTGNFSLYLPGYSPSEIKSDKNITDGNWHYLAMTFDGETAKLYVGGTEAVSQKVTRQAAVKPQAGRLAVGALADENNTSRLPACDGVVDDLRISSTVRKITGIPEAALKADEATIALWNFDKIEKSGEKEMFADSSDKKNPLVIEDLGEISLDEIDRKSYKAGPAPMDSTPETVQLKKGSLGHPAGAPIVSLNGTWEMAEGGDEAERLSKPWPDAIDTEVPGSVHTALWMAGKIPDPYFGMQDAKAREKSFKT